MRNKLNPGFVRNAPVGKHADGSGLWLHKTSATSAGKWTLRLSILGDRREMGLGSVNDAGLAEVRKLAAQYRLEAKQGLDPIALRRARIAKAKAENFTLRQIVNRTFEARKAQLKGEGQNGNWLGPLENHLLPKLGDKPILQINQNMIVEALGPIWHEKGETARKCINRLNLSLKHAAALGLEVDLNATAKAKALMGASRQKSANIPAMAWKDVPSFYEQLTSKTSVQLALRLLILTATRSQEIRLATFDQIEGAVWTIPSENYKTGKEHRVPLSAEALAVIEQARQFARNDFLFPGQRVNTISDMSMSKAMRTMGFEARPHGFRSSFRTWCAEQTDTPREVAETALGHVGGGKVELAYRRTDYLDQRAALMERWGEHVTNVRATS